MRSRSVAFLVTLLGLALLVLPAASASQAQPVHFQVGAGAASISPDIGACAPAGCTVYSGGFGTSPPLTAANEAEPNNKLFARAIYVSNGTHAVAMVLVDSQGLFAALQNVSTAPGTSALGIDGMRTDAAAKLATLGVTPAMSASDIIVQGSHSHSAPTSMGIWGPIPTDYPYLQVVHDQVVKAIVDAATSRRDAYLQYASIEGSFLDNVNNNDTDSYAGWVQDGQTSVLRAVDPATGETIATYANVPAHPDLLNGSSCKLLTADYFGVVRHNLEQSLGGTAIVGGATLGREESPVQSQGCGSPVNGTHNLAFYGSTVSELVTRALAENGRFMTDSTIGGAQQFVYAPGWNAALLGLVLAYQAGPTTDFGGNYPINRSIMPPYLVGNTLGTPATALRIGSIAYVSLNGEAFPEVRHAIAASVYGADMIVGLSLGNDQIGYYGVSHDFPFQAGTPYGSDHLLYNVSPVLGDEMVQTQIQNLKALGFTTSPVGVPLPESNNWGQSLQPSVQILASPFRADASSPSGTATIWLDAVYTDAAVNGGSRVGAVHFDLGDGTAVDCCGGRMSWFTHEYAPGTYNLRASAVDDQGRVTSWPPADHPDWGRVVVYPALEASIASAQAAPGSSTMTALTEGGSGSILAYRWSFSDGSTDFGRTVTHAIPSGGTATLTVTDATGGTATAMVAIP
ncbi:MAG: PKD domain-containing protein [Actinomycetota bacterium]